LDTSLNSFKLTKLQFILKASDGINLPVYKGSTFRGGFGNAFKKIVCVNRDKDCDLCMLKGKCVYSYVFETPPPSDTSKMRKYPFAPHPFIVASITDMNKMVKLGFGWPMGVFELIDFVGLDTMRHILEYLHRENGDPRYAPPLTLKKLVKSGDLGRKPGSKGGFYEYFMAGEKAKKGDG